MIPDLNVDNTIFYIKQQISTNIFFDILEMLELSLFSNNQKEIVDTEILLKKCDKVMICSENYQHKTLAALSFKSNILNH